MSSLKFGTAGLRAPVGSGPDKMNVSTVTRATAGVAAWMKKKLPSKHADGRYYVAVGYDARYGSHTLARAAAETFAGAGFGVTLIADPVATPVLAWLVRNRNLDAGVQITASHNPAPDNGYKLYVDGGMQLLSPADTDIEEEIAKQPAAHEIPRSEAKSIDLAAQDGYATAISALVATGEQAVLRPRRTLKILYTPMHGVGGESLESALRNCGFGDVNFVASQRWPDPEFPTVEFPNPEEPGATDALLEEAARLEPDLLIALDPDADRCMLGVKDPSAEKGYRMLRGDETGPLLARRVLAKRVASKKDKTKPVVATTVVSSQLLGAMAEREGWDYVETLTGFKHLARAAESRPGHLAFAYEEAIGTCPSPSVVADKDGVATALIAAAWAAELKEEGRSLLDELADIEVTYGAYRTAQVAKRCTSADAASHAVAVFKQYPPKKLAGMTVAASDIVDSSGRRAEGVRLTGEDGSLHLRVVARPSGTEPKAKFYLELHGPAEKAADVEQRLEQLIQEIRNIEET
ncbi:phospho-sugar mutase [Corynebacterium anserum]|uniref:Phospho-sugar mutase n=1 Tax=Corynebacterium anserum TaxID=2684406 RepID=A0A7G7YPS8_9CORY|nr:phospho-sugar mutase [Corynebacterium anserum]QNH96498.1 phospho-sugar mutase [Corynebacterium anserum]